jgi:hypothetical protein
MNITTTFTLFSTIMLGTMKSLQATNTIDVKKENLRLYHEIAVHYHEGIEDLYKELTPQERVAAYFLYRACLPANRILTDQHHRHALVIVELFEHLYKHRPTVESTMGTEFFEEIKTFLAYVWSSHGQYFKREFAHNKRSPHKIGLTHITPQSLIHALKATGFEEAEKTVHEIADSLFNETIEPTLTVQGSIEKSAVNIYSENFTQKDYDALDKNTRGHVNAYYTIDPITKQPHVRHYSAHDKYADELSVSMHWILKAHDWTKKFPEQFDTDFVESLALLAEYLKTGAEELFKAHSRAWLKTRSRLDYTFGFIEVYEDPLSTTGSMEAEITIKNYSLHVLTQLLPSLEKKLPVPEEFKRENMNIIPNASINTQVFGAGDMGPLISTAAYCLPNYSDIRSKDGSKQIIYKARKSLAERMNPKLARKLLKSKEHVDWHKKHDPDYTLSLDLENLLTILHETIGHASGRLATHIFREGDPLSFGEITYKVGDTIPLTNELSAELLVGHYSALEELRAEIIALYIAVNHLDELVEKGFLTQWHTSLTRRDLISKIILQMTRAGMRRLLTQQDDASEVAGAHAQANTCIMNYLIDKGGIEIVIEDLQVNNTTYKVADLHVVNLGLCLTIITELMQRVQRIKSTGDRVDAQALMSTYAYPIRKDLLKIIKDNQKAVLGDLKGSALIYPFFTPLYKDGQLYDVTMTWPQDFFEANILYSKLALSKEDEEIECIS